MAQGKHQHQVMQEDLKAKEETWRTKYQDLKQMLAENEEQISRAVQKGNQRSIIHVETLAELSSMQDGLKESQLKCAALEESIQRLSETNESHQRELEEKEESLKKMIGAENERELGERQKVFAEEFQKQEENMRKELFEQEENFKKQLIERKQNYDVKLLEKDNWMREQLLNKEETFKKLLAEVCQPLEAKGQQWAVRMKELEDQIQDSNRIREQQEEETNMEIQRLSELLSQLQHLQAEKEKKKKRFWRWKFWKRRQ